MTRELGVDRLRTRVDAVRVQVSNLTGRVVALRRCADQLASMREDAQEAQAQIARLERVLDFDRVSAHARRAVTQAVVAGDPVPHLLISDVLPADTYSALIDGIPPPVFFEGDAAHGQEARVPLRLAPLSSVIAFSFLDQVARVLKDLLLLHLAEPLAAYTRARFPSLPPFAEWGVEITLTEGRLVRRTPGFARQPPGDHPWNFVTGILYLGRQPDTETYGSRLQDAVVMVCPNTVLAWVGPLEAHMYASIPADAPADIERYAYQFSIGPARGARRKLDALIGPAR